MMYNGGERTSVEVERMCVTYKSELRTGRDDFTFSAFVSRFTRFAFHETSSHLFCSKPIGLFIIIHDLLPRRKGCLTCPRYRIVDVTCCHRSGITSLPYSFHPFRAIVLEQKEQKPPRGRVPF
jgi:hypothetical protein